MSDEFLRDRIISAATKYNMRDQVIGLLNSYPVNSTSRSISTPADDYLSVLLSTGISSNGDLFSTYIHELKHIDTVAAYAAEWRQAVNTGSYSIAIDSVVRNEAKGVVAEYFARMNGAPYIEPFNNNTHFGYLNGQQLQAAVDQTIAQTNGIVDRNSPIFTTLLTNNVMAAIAANNYNGTYTEIKARAAATWLLSYTSATEFSCAAPPSSTISNLSAGEQQEYEDTAHNFSHQMALIGDAGFVEVQDAGGGVTLIVGRDENGEEVFRLEVRKGGNNDDDDNGSGLRSAPLEVDAIVTPTEFDASSTKSYDAHSTSILLPGGQIVTVLPKSVSTSVMSQSLIQMASTFNNCGPVDGFILPPRNQEQPIIAAAQ